jgi:hypothetical protein
MEKGITPPAWLVRGPLPHGQWRQVRTYGRKIDLGAVMRRPAGVWAELRACLRSPRGEEARVRVRCDGDASLAVGGRAVALMAEGDARAGRLQLGAGDNEIVLTVGAQAPARVVGMEIGAGAGARFVRCRPPGAGDPDHISGVFLYWRPSMAAEGPREWDERFAMLRRLGMDTLIVQFSVIEGTAYYPSELYPPAAQGDIDPTGEMLEAASRAGVAVHLGVASDEKRWWQIPYRPEEVPQYAAEESARNVEIARELIERYRDEEALAGIYLSHEIHLGEEWAGENMPHLAELFNRMCDGVKGFAPELAVSTAPFFSLRGTIEQYERRWRALLRETRLDILMLQDGVGCERNITVDNMVPYYESLARVCEETGVEFWTDLELFDLKPPKVVAPERVAVQLAREAPYVSKVVAYSIADLTPEFAAALPNVRLA